jgi:RNA polymerase sigma factor (sigma-70 family)
VKIATFADKHAIVLQALEFEPVLRSCLYKYVRNKADVDELVQETYARLLAFDSLPSHVRSIRAYVLTVARNVALDWRRHQAVVAIDLIPNLETLRIEDEASDVESWVENTQQLDVLMKAVGALTQRCRQVFTLRKIYGYSQKEIAASLRISENTVEQHLTKAVRRLAANVPLATAAAEFGDGRSIRRRKRVAAHPAIVVTISYHGL